MFQERYNQILFSIGDLSFSLGSVVATALVGLIIIILYRLSKEKLFRKLLQNSEIDKAEVRSLYNNVRIFLFFLFILFAVYLLGLNYNLFGTDNINIVLVIGGLLIIYGARIMDWIISNFLVHNYYTKQTTSDTNIDRPASEAKVAKWAQYIVYLFALFLIIRNFNLDITFFHTEFQGINFNFKLSNIISAILIMLIARVLISIITQIILFGVYQRREIDIGAQIALNQLLTYVIFVIAAVIALRYLGFNMTVIWGGAAALLVGIGLGLQQTFNDLFSGILLLFERSVTVGDILRLPTGIIGTVKRIGLRTTIVETLANESLIVPNSKLVVDSVENLTHHNNKVRFSIKIGVAYGSDTEQVKTLLLGAVRKNPYVLDYPAPFIRFNSFGDSTLNFELFFFSRNLIVIEDIKSDIRFEIDKLFRENQIEIPFPQRVVWSKKVEE